MFARIQLRRDTAERWAEYNPILLLGEVGLVTDSPEFLYKVGDGISTWNELPYTENYYSVYNVSVSFPTSGINGTNVYTAELARAMVPEAYRILGLILVYLTNEGWKVEQFIGTTQANVTNNWLTSGFWKEGFSGGSSDDSVKFVPQALTEDQKAQARANIGAMGSGQGSVGTDDIADGAITMEKLAAEVLNAISAGSDSIALSATPDVIFSSTATSITIDAALGVDNSQITSTRILRNGSILTTITTGTKNVVQYVDANVQNVAGTITYTAEFTVGSSVKSKSISVNVVDKIYYGSGTDYSSAVTAVQTPKVTPEGSYTVTVTTTGHFVFFNVPDTMEIRRAELSGIEFPLNAPISVVISGSAYKSYKSGNAYQSGSFTIVLY